jgi:hypothetical protein
MDNVADALFGKISASCSGRDTEDRHKP